MSETPIKTDIIVLGAGISGLAAADVLAQKGMKPVVLEKEQDVGGLCRSIRCDGYVFDLGGHRFLPRDERIACYVKNLFVESELCLRKRISKIYIKGKYLNYPPEFSDIIFNLGLGTCFKAAIDSTFSRIAHLVKRNPEISLKDWLINRFGTTLYDIYFGPYSYKLWGRKTSNISADWAPQRISVSNFRVALKKILTKDARGVTTYAKQFLYPAGGIGRIPQLMAEKVLKNGGMIFGGHNITSITENAEAFIVDTVRSNKGKRTFVANKIISTIPINETLDILRPVPPENIIDRARNLNYRSVRFLNIMIDLPKITDNTWLYIPEREYIFFRIQEMANWHPDNCPLGKTSLILEIACEKGGRLWNMEEKDLLKICIKDLKKIGISIENKIIGHFSSFSEHGYPVYSLKYKKNLEEIYGFTKKMRGFIVTGRQGLFRYLNMDKAIESGLNAAQEILGNCKANNFMNYGSEKEYLESNLHLKNYE